LTPEDPLAEFQISSGAQRGDSMETVPLAQLARREN